MSEQRLRAIYTALLTVSLWYCIPAMAQETQPVNSAPPIHLRTGRQAQMPVTVENKCPQRESFSVTTEGLPGNLVRVPKPIAIDANKSEPSKLIFDTRNVDPGLYRGQIVIACVTCGTECVQDREVFPLQFQIDLDVSATAQNGGQGTLKLRDESMLVIDEPAPGEAGKDQQRGTKPNGNALQDNAGAPGAQPGQALAESNPPAGPVNPPGGVGPTGPHGNDNTHAPPGKKPETGESSQPPGGQGGNGPTAPRGGDNPSPPPAPGTGPDDGLPPPPRPRSLRVNTTPCPCEKICAEAVAAEQKAQQLLEDYLKIEALVEQTETVLSDIRDAIRQDRQISDHYLDTGYPDMAAQTNATIAGLEKDADSYRAQLQGLVARASLAAIAYRNAAVEAANKRLECDECVDQHPECPQTIRAPGDPTENPPPTQEKPPGTTPGENPNGHTPPDDHGGGGYGHEEAAQCPELHRGCIALVADLMKNDATTLLFKKDRTKYEAELKEAQKELNKSKDGGPKWLKDHVEFLKEELHNGMPVDFASEFKNAGCKVYAPDPELDLKPVTYKENETADERKINDVERQKNREHNEKEMARLQKVIADFRTAVASDKPEVAIVIVDAHGSSAIPKSYDGTTLDRCGQWGNAYDIEVKRENELYRARFHDGNYQAVNKNVCGWFNVDLSCYGGLTPKVVDELDNYATSTCQKASAINCSLHAGWGADGSFSSATAVAPCDYGNIYRNANRISQLIDNHIANTPAAGSGTPAAGSAPDFQWLIDGLKRIERGGTAYYSDRGYDKDPPVPVHSHFGYPSNAAGAPCTGGKCGK
jgi:hypothetical protein